MPTETAAQPRALGVDDAEVLLELVQVCDIADMGEPDYELADVLDDFSRPSFRAWALPGDGGLAAYCWLEKRPEHETFDADVRVRPGGDAALGDVLLDVVRAEAATTAPGEAVRFYVSVDNTADHARLAAAGAVPIRHFWRMSVTWGDAPLPSPAAPAGVVVRPVADTEADLRIAQHVMETAFEDHFGSVRREFDPWIARQRGGSGFDLGLWWIAEVAGEPAAAVICRAWPEQGYVQGLATLREFRGRGLGRLLLRTSFAAMHARGYRRASLGVDATNPTGAVALYESVGMSVAHEWVLLELPPLH